jgi:hypothetical protein
MRRRCQQGVSGSHGYSTQSERSFRGKNGLLVAKTHNSTHSPALARRDHNPQLLFADYFGVIPVRRLNLGTTGPTLRIRASWVASLERKAWS